MQRIYVVIVAIVIKMQAAAAQDAGGVIMPPEEMPNVAVPPGEVLVNDLPRPPTRQEQIQMEQLRSVSGIN